jgi:hypothetical protein
MDCAVFYLLREVVKPWIGGIIVAILLGLIDLSRLCR